MTKFNGASMHLTKNLNNKPKTSKSHGALMHSIFATIKQKQQGSTMHQCD